MLTIFKSNGRLCNGLARRDFLRVGGLSVVGLSVAEQAAQRAERQNCIFLLMTGGPSQLETFDPKPTAPSEVRKTAKSQRPRFGDFACLSRPRSADQASYRRA